MAKYPTENIHLPSHRLSVRAARVISVIGGISIAFSACIIFFGWLLHVTSLFSLLGNKLFNLPTVVALIGCSVTIFFYGNIKKSFLVLIGLIVFGIGLVTVLIYFIPSLSFLSIVSAINLKSGVIFVLFGYALLISISQIRHRFHYSQLIVFIALFLGLFSFLESLYNLGDNALFSSVLFIIVCLSFLLTKSNRGFVGLFTTDTNSSKLARFSLIYYAFLPPMLGLLFLIEENLEFLNDNGRLALLIIALMLISVIITWINVKLLYPSEIENYLTKEALRVNNITLDLDSKDMSSKVNEMEKAKKDLADKLNNKESLADYIESAS